MSRTALTVLAAVVVTLASGCSAASSPAARSPATAQSPTAQSSTARPSATGPSATAPASAAASPSAAASRDGGVTVSGAYPVPASGSQDTAAEAGAAGCDASQLQSDQQTGSGIATGFSATGLPVSAALLRHFLAGSGTAVSYPASSRLAAQARDSGAFQTVNAAVEATVTRELRAGQTAVRLTAGELPLVDFTAAGGDLYWGFRGTQGLSVTGRVHRAGPGYTGTLSYVIRDSYGFPAGDTLGGFGAPMRYLQTACGAPQHAGGARWFPDSITVTVPFRAQPAG